MNKWIVVRARLDPVVGSEQAGNCGQRDRINKLLPVVTVLPIINRKGNGLLYSNEALLPAGSCGLPTESIALAYQIRTFG